MFIKSHSFFGYFHTVYKPIFANFDARCKIFRLTTTQQFSVGTMEATPLQKMDTKAHSAPDPMFIRGSPIFVHFYPLYTPILAYLLAPCIMFRLIRVQHFSVGTVGVWPLKNMNPEVSSASGPIFIRGSSLFGHFYTVYAPILAYLVDRGIMFRLTRVLHFSVGAVGMSPLQKTCTLRDVRHQVPSLSGVPPTP